MKKENKIGDVVFFRENDYNRAILYYTNFIEAANRFIIEYEGLLKRKPTTEEIRSLVHTPVGINNIRSEYSKIIKGEFTGTLGELLAETFEKSINQAIIKLSASRNTLNDLYHQYSHGMGVSIYLEQLNLIDGVATYDPEKVKEDFTTRIENEGQLNLYNQMLVVTEACNKFNELAKSYGSKYENFGSGGFFNEDISGTMSMDAEMISFIKTQPVKAKKVA